ncbi:ATPase with role in protein import into the ER [Mortierella sp. NVP41]|nr:ATPase with role in protein import into the ER [Mortierella sp. NVP41]
MTLLISRMRKLAESQMGETMNRTVLVIPESFSSDQRWAVVEAAESVGLTVRRVNERRFYPMFVYGGVSRTLMMVNLEGEVLEMTMVELGGNWREKEAVEVKDGRFGERAAERVVAEYLVDEYLRRQEGEVEVESLQRRRGAILGDKRTMDRLDERVVKVKELFSDYLLWSPPRSEPTSFSSSCSASWTSLSPSIRVEVESLHNGQDLSLSLDLSTWQELRKGTLTTTILPAMEQMLKSCKSHVHHVLLMGSSPRVPEILQLVESYFEGRIKVPQTIDPALVGVYGAAGGLRNFKEFSERYGYILF